MLEITSSIAHSRSSSPEPSLAQGDPEDSALLRFSPSPCPSLCSSPPPTPDHLVDGVLSGHGDFEEDDLTTPSGFAGNPVAPPLTTEGGGGSETSEGHGHTSQAAPIANGYVEIDMLEYQLGGIILDALEVVERLAIAEERTQRLRASWSVRPDPHFRLNLQREVVLASLTRQIHYPDTLLVPPHAQALSSYTREQVRTLGERFSRHPSVLEPVVREVWDVRCPPTVFVR
ncbi:hypothetical protein NMY22_g4397 [Coprinellus aureogranulatus]|nr:hypothetical protein NMY22_g4397 [Coprinellus aureogranulatus]